MSDHSYVSENGLAVEPPELTYGQVVFRIASILREQQSRIIANWALRVSTIPTFRAMPEIALEDLQRQIPELFDAALSAFATSGSTIDADALERAQSISAAHGELRRANGMAIGVLISELHLLRLEVWAAMWRAIDSERVPISAPQDLQGRLSTIFDALVISAAEAWTVASATDQTSVLR